MLPVGSRCWHLAARKWHRLLEGGRHGRRSTCQQQVSGFLTGGRRHVPDHVPDQPEESSQKSRSPARERSLTVRPFGQLKARLPCHVALGPLDPHKYPNADQVLVAAKKSDHHPNGSNLDKVHVSYDEVLMEVTVLSEDLDSAASLDVKAPVKFDLDIKTSGNGCVTVEKMEGDNCRIEAETGAITLQSVKSQKTDIKAKGGEVICLGTVQGNADIHVSQGSSVNIEKLQGSSVNISTKNGLLKTRYLYAESSFLSSTTGDILLGSVHGKTNLQTITGNIEVDSAEASLKASSDQGNIDVYIIGQVGDVHLKSQKGSITIKVPATLNAYLQLSGSKIDVSPEIHLQGVQKKVEEGHTTVTGHMNPKDEKGKFIKANTRNGTINLKAQTWFESVKLKST